MIRVTRDEDEDSVQVRIDLIWQDDALWMNDGATPVKITDLPLGWQQDLLRSLLEELSNYPAAREIQCGWKGCPRTFLAPRTAAFSDLGSSRPDGWWTFGSPHYVMICPYHAAKWTDENRRPGGDWTDDDHVREDERMSKWIATKIDIERRP